jgi:hypothetical protein
MDNTLSTTVSTNGTGVQIPWAAPQPSGSLARGIRFINPAGSGAFDFSLNGGAAWHTRSISAGFYPEDFPAKFAITDLQIRRNGGTDVAGLTIDLFF